MADTTTANTKVKTEAKTGTGGRTSTDAKPEATTEAKAAAANDAGSGAERESSASDAPMGYSRGENQKLVTDAYRKNWDAIFGNNPRRSSKT